MTTMTPEQRARLYADRMAELAAQYPEVERLRAAGLGARFVNTGGWCLAIEVCPVHSGEANVAYVLVTDEEYGALPHDRAAAPVQRWLVGGYCDANEFDPSSDEATWYITVEADAAPGRLEEAVASMLERL